MASRKERLARQAQAAAQRQQVVTAAYQFQGPIPSPQDLANYDRVLPGLADRLITTFENQAAHRMRLENSATRSENIRSYCGLAAGVIVALAFLAMAGFLIHEGHDVAGGVLGTVDIVALVGTFIYGTNSRKDERLRREQMLLGKG